MPAIADDTPNTNSFARRNPMPIDCAAVSESRMAASTRPSRPARRLWASTNISATTHDLVEVERAIAGEVEAEQMSVARR